MANLLVNGNLSASAGEGATSTPGPGWETDYLVPAGGQLFAGVGAGQARYAFFTGDAGDVCNNFATANPILALGGKSMAVNVGVVGQDIIRWINVPLVNGARYRIGMDAAVIHYPFSVALVIDGTPILAIPAPPVASVWFNTSSEFTWTGTTGPHTVALRTNTGAAGGNDHAFDNFFLERTLVLPVPGCCTAALACYRDVTPCVAEPTQTVGSTVHAFNTASMQNDTTRPMRTGGIPCGSANISDQQAADNIINGSLSGTIANTVFLQSLLPVGPTDPIPASFDLRYTIPRDGITHFRLYHGYGSILNDFDGISGGQVRLFNSVGALLAGPLAINANNTGAPVDTLLAGGPYNDVARVVLDGMTRWGADGRCAGLREVQLVGSWNSTLTWDCGGMGLTALIEGAAAGITIAGGMLTQTAGPHTMRFNAASGTPWSAVITTDQPGWFSTLVLDQDNPEVVINDGGAAGSATFSVEFTFDTPTRRAVVDLTQEPPVWTDAATGEVLAPDSFTPVECRSSNNVHNGRNR